MLEACLTCSPTWPISSLTYQLYIHTRTPHTHSAAVAGICEALRDGACPKLERFSLAYNWVGVLGSREIGAWI